MIKQLLQFVARWLVNSFGLAVCSQLSVLNVTGGLLAFLIAGLILAFLNGIIKPLLVIFSLPLIDITLGFFLIFINGLLILVLRVLYDHITFGNFGHAIVAGIVIGLVNYIVTIFYERFMSNE